MRLVRSSGESVPFSAGGLYSTLEDMYRWDQALYSEKLLTRASIERLFTPNAGDYGYGWRISSLVGRRAVSHGGAIEGFSTYILRFPDDRAAVIVLMNVQDTNAEVIAVQMARMLFTPQ